jgi:hypothetical protein
MQARGADTPRARDGAGVGVVLDVFESAKMRTAWLCEKWSEEACDFARRKLQLAPDAEVGSQIFKSLGFEPEEALVVPGNLLLNEGIQRLLDLLIVAGGTGYNNANAFIGVGDTNTAEAATQTELQATQNAANRFYKGMVATWPQRTAQTVDWKSDFTTGEANFAWAEWTIAAGATTASGSGFLVGTTNLNRKVQSLGTKASGTWTLTASLTIS